MIKSKILFPVNNLVPRKRWLYGWLPFWIYNVLVLEGAIINPNTVRFPFLADDAIRHSIEFFIFFLVAYNACRLAKSRRLSRVPENGAFLWCMGMAVATECAQYFAPPRTPDMRDWTANVAGTLLAFFLMRLRYYV